MPTGTVASRLAAVTDRVAAAAARAGRSPDAIRVVAVGKAHPVELLAEAYEAGIRDFGENRAQEMAAKAPQLPADVRWHFVGPLQRNKVRLVRPVAALLHSLDRLRLAQEWAKGDEAPPPVLLEVNLGDEPQKGGVAPDDAAALAEAAAARGIPVHGLMAIPPMAAEPSAVRPYFVQLAALQRRLVEWSPMMTELSMGMTGDFDVAVEEGATLVRVGQAIFGPRPG